MSTNSLPILCRWDVMYVRLRSVVRFLVVWVDGEILRSLVFSKTQGFLTHSFITRSLYGSSPEGVGRGNSTLREVYLVFILFFPCHSL